MNFKVIDNDYPVQLVDFESMNITVVAPAPENLIATPSGNTIILNWDRSICPNAVGYRIYRRNGYYGFFPDHCETGVPAYTGYSLIAATNTITDTTYADNNNGAGLVRGVDYCYMVIAYFADDAESYASLEVCTELSKDVPVITNVSVKNTDAVNGSLWVGWSKPTEFDTVQIPGPYKYLIWRGTGYNPSSYYLIDSLADINDTIYNDTLINTQNQPYRYRIDFYNDEPGNRFFVGSTATATSIFLMLTPSDNKLTLTWQPDVPWLNDYYVVFKQNPLTTLYDSIAVVTAQTYTDTGLINGASYCYYVKSVGRYTASGFAFPLVNLSQKACGIPIDNEPPCAPVLTGEVDCENIQNLLQWALPDLACADDVVAYNLYYSPGEGSDYSLIFSTTNLQDTSFLHTDMGTIVGCYYVTAVDSFNNQSPPSNLVCFDIDQCYLYQLPNVFTPNDDGSNDEFRPFPYDFVEKINMIIFNRWGTVVFKTEDPDINWDGKDKNSKRDCSVGVYYYVCDVFEKRLGGTQKRSLTGIIHLVR